METTDPGLEWLPRRFDGRLAQRVDVRFTPNGPLYSYAWLLTDDLEVGDQVQAPRPPQWVGPYNGLATVVNTRSGYEGPIRTLVAKFSFSPAKTVDPIYLDKLDP